MISMLPNITIAFIMFISFNKTEHAVQSYAAGYTDTKKYPTGTTSFEL